MRLAISFEAIAPKCHTRGMRDDVPTEAFASLASARAALQITLDELALIFKTAPAEIRDWFVDGIPPELDNAVTDLVAAASELQRNIRPERIAVVVRNPAPALNGRSLVQVAIEDGPAAMRTAVAETFDVRRING